MWKRILYLVLLATYWASVVQLLRYTSPTFEDGFGPTSSFNWGGDMPTPGPVEYESRRAHYDLLFSLPYYVAALVVTALGCVVAPAVTNRLRSRWPSLATRFVTLGLLLTLFAIADTGIHNDLWIGPLFLFYPGLGLGDALGPSFALLTSSILSEYVEIIRRWLFR